MRAYVIPQSYDLYWPDYQVEGAYIPQTLIDASIASTQVDRTNGGTVNQNGSVPPSPANTPGASPLASVSVTATASATLSHGAGHNNDAGGLNRTSGAISMRGAAGAATWVTAACALLLAMAVGAGVGVAAA